jgi:hypothetical protein
VLHGHGVLMGVISYAVAWTEQTAKSRSEGYELGLIHIIHLVLHGDGVLMRVVSYVVAWT